MSLSLTIKDICNLLGCREADLTPACHNRIRKINPVYRVLSKAERDKHILHTLNKIQDQISNRSVSDNLKAFENGWNENYKLCLSNGVDEEALKPKYVRTFEKIRCLGDFIAPEDQFLCDSLFSLATTFSFTKFLNEFDPIYEFGCGSGRYVFEMSELYPDKTIVGLDWTLSSQKILQLIAETGRNVKGLRFDILNPDEHPVIKPNSAVLTISALEQIGERFHPFINYLLKNQPGIVIHHEPIEEFYNEEDLFDYLALMYHRKRGYLSGYWTMLKKLEGDGKIEILEARRLAFGDSYHEAASLIVWRPNPRNIIY